MESKLLPPAGGKTVLVFGCQSITFNIEDFHALRETVLSSPDFTWALDVLAELPIYYRTATTYIPSLCSIPGTQQLRELSDWMRTGNVTVDRFPLPYIQHAPLLMLTHFTQYTQYLQLTQPKYRENGTVHTEQGGVAEIVGFCIGFLSAAVASAASGKAQLSEYAAVALRLAMLMGALGDAQEQEMEYTSLATVWKDGRLGGGLERVLENFPESYITVHYDENRSTIMTPRASMPRLHEALTSAGFGSNQVDFNGRYHWSGHKDTVQSLISMCDADTSLQLPDASTLTIPTRTNVGGQPVTTGKLHHLVLQSILSQQCEWHQTISSVYTTNLTPQSSILIEFGPERCIPPSILRSLRTRAIHFSDLPIDLTSRLSPLHSTPPSYPTDIAITGASCRVAGADDLPQFWSLLSSGVSQHAILPAERYKDFETPWRPEAQKPWFGNFVSDIDAFDHRFFKKVPREVMSQDPQQRLLLQVAYQALEQAGYFHSPNRDQNIGCYVASCTVDYEHNVNCHPATAYAATGLLRSFMAGKLSHYFGWRGPAFCIDSACSGSAVALHQACQAILKGECSSALVGGANAIMSPLAYDNLAGASFVSPTGPCKPFDAKADGYCRGEGFAAVYIKKMSDALADGDVILGTIAATAVEQNDNCTPIVVPDAPSLAGLFEKVTRRARIRPRDISVVEAHGTGTQAGDPAEYSSVRQTLGGPQRDSPLALGSVKGLVGHTEGVSGLIALVKVLLMIHEGKIPPQPNFHTLNPYIQASGDDQIEIVTELKPWEKEFRAALINNYGASGSNASMVITQAPGGRDGGAIHGEGLALPIRMCGMDEGRLRDYARRLQGFLKEKSASLADIAFNMSRKSNPTLERQAVFSCRSRAELDTKLGLIAGGDESTMIRLKRPTRPVILCIGGQVSTFVGLDRGLYECMSPLRRHLDECDSILQAKGYTSLYPGIFSRDPISDQVQLQTQLFSLQYSTAKAWMASGLTIAAVVGHSFGELTALCVSGVLSLPDALTMIARRAGLIRDAWGADSGGMIAVEGDREDINRLLQSHEPSPATIACHNGPRSFTLAGTTVAIDAVQQTLSTPGFAHFRAKRLNVTNAFHSALVEPLLPSLEKVTDGLTLHEPTIHLERATETPSTISSSIVAEHLRQPVFFHHALQRLTNKFDIPIWLEAGSNSTITLMAAKALNSPPSHTFQAVNITSDNAIQNLTDTTISLWKESLPVRFWGFHACQTPEYSPLLLPPYQFEKSRHWMDNKKLPQPATPVSSPESESPLFTYLGHTPKHRLHKFLINTSHPDYLEPVSGHIAANTAPLAPASFMLDIAIEAIHSLPEYKDTIPVVQNMTSDAPLCLDTSRALYIELTAQEPNPNSNTHSVSLKYLTTDNTNSTPQTHCTATLTLHPPSSPTLTTDFTRYTRLIPHSHCASLLHNLTSNPNVTDILAGRNIYTLFSEIVSYAPPFRGITTLIGTPTTSAATIHKPYSPRTWADTYLVDTFSQVAGFWVNCMTDRHPDEIYIAGGMEMWMRAPKYADSRVERGDVWEVFAMHRREEGVFVSDIFVFGEDSGELVEVFLGMRYVRISKRAFGGVLRKFSPGLAAVPVVSSEGVGDAVDVGVAEVVNEEGKKKVKAGSDIPRRVKAVVAEFCAMDVGDIRYDGNMADAGVDSLMAMELAREMEEEFSCTLPATELMEADTFKDLVRCVLAAVGEDDCSSTTSTSKSSEDPGQGVKTPLSESLSEEELVLPQRAVLEAFGKTKASTDQFLMDNQCSGRVHTFAPLQIQLCVALTLEAFEELGPSIRDAEPGQQISRIPFDAQHTELVDYLYRRLEEARIVDLDGPIVVRTAITAPTRSSSAILEEVSRVYPEYAGASKLSFFTGSHLASVLRGEQDGLQLIFGTKEGQELVSWMYGDESHNVAGYKQMLDFIQRLVPRLTTSGTLKILEMGAGTGGGTKWFLPGLAKLGLDVEYTFTDISAGFVAQARRRFKEYPFVQYRVHDIEKPPADDLLGTQHIIIASNAVHATSNLQQSTRHIRQALRPDGVLMMLEMTRAQFAIDIVFGLFRGWWVFNDGRHHAITNEQRWEADLHAVGYGHVDWTDGYSPEVSVQRVIFATASGSQHERLPLGPNPTAVDPLAGIDNAARKLATDEYIKRNTEGFTAPIPGSPLPDTGHGVLVTGATGSLGSHIVAHLASLDSIKRVICLNRRTTPCDPSTRQLHAFTSKGIHLTPSQLSKLTILESNTVGPNLGLTPSQYTSLVTQTTHIIHNAWPMNGALALPSFEPQFTVMRNLITLAHTIASHRTPITFHLISSISTVGHKPLLTHSPLIPESRPDITTVLPNGYSEAKYICERILFKTLSLHPSHFRASVIRPGQISGSTESGYWNPTEHLPAIIKSSQTLKLLPSFTGLLSWTPVDKVASTITDLLLHPSPSDVYHIDNPIRQEWSEIIPILADELSIPRGNIVPFKEWIQRVKSFPGRREDNPACVMADWLEGNFERMSCGGVVLGVEKAGRDSGTLRGVGVVGGSVVKGYVRGWREMGFLN